MCRGASRRCKRERCAGNAHPLTPVSELSSGTSEPCPARPPPPLVSHQVTRTCSRRIERSRRADPPTNAPTEVVAREPRRCAALINASVNSREARTPRIGSRATIRYFMRGAREDALRKRRTCNALSTARSWIQLLKATRASDGTNDRYRCYHGANLRVELIHPPSPLPWTRSLCSACSGRRDYLSKSARFTRACRRPPHYRPYSARKSRVIA